MIAWVRVHHSLLLSLWSLMQRSHYLTPRLMSWWSIRIRFCQPDPTLLWTDKSCISHLHIDWIIETWTFSWITTSHWLQAFSVSAILIAAFSVAAISLIISSKGLIITAFRVLSQWWATTSSAAALHSAASAPLALFNWRWPHALLRHIYRQLILILLVLRHFWWHITKSYVSSAVLWASFYAWWPIWLLIYLIKANELISRLVESVFIFHFVFITTNIQFIFLLKITLFQLYMNYFCFYFNN